MLAYHPRRSSQEASMKMAGWCPIVADRNLRSADDLRTLLGHPQIISASLRTISARSLTLQTQVVVK